MGRNWLGGAVLLVVLEGGACGGKSTVTRGENGGEGDAHGELGGTGGASHGGIENGAGSAGHLGRGGAAAGKGGATPGKGGAAGRKGGAGAAGRAGTSTAGGGAGQGGQSNEAGAGAGGTDAGEVPGNPARPITHSELSFDLDTMKATAKLTLGASSEEGATFEVGDLHMTSVKNGSTDLAFKVSNGRLDVNVPASPTDDVVVTIDYHFHAQSDFRGYTKSGNDGYTFTWGDACGYLFPCHSLPAEGETFTLAVTGGTGELVYPKEISFEAPSYMLAWVQGDYVERALGTTSAGTSVSVFYLKSDENGDTNATLGTARLVAAFDWYETHLGAYHYGTKVASVSAPWPQNPLYGGMEHHPFWHVGWFQMSDVATHLHEAVHGWFGNGVRIRCWADLVLAEGTASYLSLHVLEELGDTATADAGWQRYEKQAQKWAFDVAWFDTCVPEDPAPPNILSDAVYAKGALFFRALEQRVGRETLIAALKTFYETWAGSAASMEDLLDSVHVSTGYDPKPCAESWLRTTALPAAEACE